MKIHVAICVGTRCTLMGALNLGTMLEDVIDEMEEEIIIDYVKCLDNCLDSDHYPMVKVNDEAVYSASAEKVFQKIQELISKEKGGGRK